METIGLVSIAAGLVLFFVSGKRLMPRITASSAERRSVEFHQTTAAYAGWWLLLYLSMALATFGVLLLTLGRN